MTIDFKKPFTYKCYPARYMGILADDLHSAGPAMHAIAYACGVAGAEAVTAVFADDAGLVNTLLPEFKVDNSSDYRKGYEDGRLTGYAVGHRHASEQAESLPQQQHADYLLEALEEARTGLRWYQDQNPGQADGSDDEAMARIDAAIARATGDAA